jgi:hypothetical protein
MIRVLLPLAALAAFLLAALPARAVQPSVTVQRMTVTIDVRADGTATILQHRR